MRTRALIRCIAGALIGLSLLAIPLSAQITSSARVGWKNTDLVVNDLQINGDETVSGDLSLPTGGIIESDSLVTALLNVDGNAHAFTALTGSGLTILFESDASEDNADSWRLVVADGGVLTWETFESGSWVAFSTYSPEAGDGGAALNGFLNVTDSIATALFRTTGAAIIGGDLSAASYETNVSPTELGYLNNVTSAIQTQIDGRLSVADLEIDLDPIPSATTASGLKLYWENVNGVSLAFGEAVYMNSSSLLDKADADGSATMLAIGIVAEAIAAGSSGDILTYGTMINAAWGWTPGKLIYISTTAGALTTAVVTGDADVSQAIATALNATTILVGQIIEVIK